MADYNLSAEEANVAKVCYHDMHDINISWVKYLCCNAKNKGNIYFIVIFNADH